MGYVGVMEAFCNRNFVFLADDHSFIFEAGSHFLSVWQEAKLLPIKDEHSLACEQMTTLSPASRQPQFCLRADNHTFVC